MAELREEEEAERMTCSDLHHHEEDAKEGLWKQVDAVVKIRKLKKELTQETKLEEEEDAPVSLQIYQKKPDIPLHEMLRGMDCKDVDATLIATECLRAILCIEDDPPIDTIIEAGLVKRLVLFLNRNKFSLQYEAAWALLNITAGTSKQTRSVVSFGAVRQFIRLLTSEAICLVELCVWALGNIAGDGAEMRDVLVENGILMPLIALVDMKSPPTFLRVLTWTISNLCRNRFPSSKMAVIKVLLAPLICLIHHKDEGVLSHACWALCHITDGANNHVEEVIKCSDLMKRLVELLDSPKIGILTPALRTICNIVSAKKSHVQVLLAMKEQRNWLSLSLLQMIADGRPMDIVNAIRESERSEDFGRMRELTIIDLDVLDYMSELMNHRRRHIKKDACSIVASMTSKRDQIETVIDYDLLPPLIEVIKTGDTKSKREAVRAVKYLALYGHLHQVNGLIQEGVFRPLCALMTTKSVTLMLVLLDAIRNLLEAARRMGFHEWLVFLLDETDCVQKMKDLRDHANTEIYRKSLEIDDIFFTAYEADEYI